MSQSLLNKEESKSNGKTRKINPASKGGDVERNSNKEAFNSAKFDTDPAAESDPYLDSQKFILARLISDTRAAVPISELTTDVVPFGGASNIAIATSACETLARLGAVNVDPQKLHVSLNRAVLFL